VPSDSRVVEVETIDEKRPDRSVEVVDQSDMHGDRVEYCRREVVEDKCLDQVDHRSYQQVHIAMEAIENCNSNNAPYRSSVHFAILVVSKSAQVHHGQWDGVVG